jgi:hypothetical protein
MSQHYIDADLPSGEPVVILLGFDRPLGGYFMVIHAPDDQTDLRYGNLIDPVLATIGGIANNVDYFLDKLNELGLQVPEAMVDQVRFDGAHNVGNRLVQWSRRGDIEHDTGHQQ